MPRPSPLLAPLTSPAISVKENEVGTILRGLTISTILSNRLSFTSTTPTLGSIVAKGKLAASAPDFVMALNNVDLPTLGKPTIPAVKLIIHLYKNIIKTINTIKIRIMIFTKRFRLVYI